MWYFLLFLMGLTLGSFLNVVAFRFKEGKFLFAKSVIGGRSHCSQCKRTLKWYELMPLLSYVLQLGRCRSCGSRLSLGYPVVELLAGIIVPAVAFYFFHYEWLAYAQFVLNGESIVVYAAVFLWALVFLLLLLLSVIDYREYLIPDELPYLIASLGVCWVALLTYADISSVSHGSFLGQYAGIFGMWRQVWVNHFLGALVGSLVIGAIFFLSRGQAIGFGDVILLGALGFLFGWPDVVVILFLSFLIGAVFSLLLIVRRLKGIKDFVPFAPFVALASLLVFFYGADLLHWYFIIFNPFG